MLEPRGPRTRLGPWGAGLALSLVLALTFLSLQAFQITSEGVSRPALRRALNALVEGDAIIERNYEDLRGRAEAAPEGETLQLRDYPVAVSLTREEVLDSTPESIRLLLLDRAAGELYDDGTGVLRDGGATGGRFTAAGLIDDALGFLRSRVHGTLAVVTVVLAVASAALAVALVAACRGFGRLVALGIVTVIASLPLLAGGAGSRAYASAASDDGEYVRAELMDIAASLSLLPLRNGAALVVLGLVVLVAGATAARLSDGARPDA
jgi:hypothetical protein